MTSGSRPDVEKIWSECLEGSTTIHSSTEEKLDTDMLISIHKNEQLDTLIKILRALNENIIWGCILIFASILLHAMFS